MTDPVRFDLPTTIGPYRVGRLLGGGGMGIVHLGERDDIATQRVAIKILTSVPFAAATGTLGLHEENILTALEHPNIVRLLDRGVTDSGLRYFVMEYVDGVSIDAYCDLHRLGIRERIRLIFRVMAAVEYAHQRLIIHADLKPANIFVTNEGEPKLMDFGIATIIGQDPADAALYTPEFASPEQRSGERLTVSSDIYSLGIVAKLLLTEISVSAPTWKDEAPDSFVHRLKTLDRDSLRKAADARSTTPADLIADIRGDLEAVLLKAIHMAPAERYLSVSDFAADLKSFLDYRPVSAKRVNYAHRAHRWMQRHRIAATVSIIFVVVVTLSVSGVVFQAALASQQRRLAQNRLHEMVRLTGALDGELYDSVQPLAQSGDARRALLKQATETLDKLAADDSKDPALALELARQYAKLAELQATEDTQSQASDQRRALLNLEKGIGVLKRISKTDSEYAEKEKQLGEMRDLQKRIAR